MEFSRRFALLPMCLIATISCAVSAGAADGPLPANRVVSEDTSEQRRLVNVRIERRLKEAELMHIGEYIRERQSRAFARTIVNFFLPGQALQSGAWASVAFTTDAKVTINGLKQEDEDVLVAEFNADKRNLLGSWLTSPPAAPGRFTIFSDEGKVFGEWRLRNGQRTVDELIDVSTRSERRFEVLGGSTYVLSRSGDLEIREKTALVAVAERIRPSYLALPTSVALGHRQDTAPPIAKKASQPMPKASVAEIASPAQPEPAASALAAPKVAAETKLDLPNPTAAADAAAPVAAAKPKAKVHSASKGKEPRTRSAKSRDGATPGEQIAAKLGNI